MSTLAAVTARETAFVFGSGILHGIAPGAIDGFAVGALATGACCLVVAAPRLLHRARLSTRDGMWGTGERRSKVQRDYFATPVDYDPAPDVTDLAATSPAVTDPAMSSPAVTDPAMTSPAVTDPAMTSPAVTGLAVTNMRDGGPIAVLFAPEAEALASWPIAAGELYAAPTGGDPFDPVARVDPFGPATSVDPATIIDPFGPLASVDLLDAVDINDVFLPGTTSDGAGRDQPGRSGHRSKHRMTTSDADRRSEIRRRPRHAAPSVRRANRMTGRLAAVPLEARS